MSRRRARWCRRLEIRRINRGRSSISRGTRARSRRRCHGDGLLTRRRRRGRCIRRREVRSRGRRSCRSAGLRVRIRLLHRAGIRIRHVDGNHLVAAHHRVTVICFYFERTFIKADDGAVDDTSVFQMQLIGAHTASKDGAGREDDPCPLHRQQYGKRCVFRQDAAASKLSVGLRTTAAPRDISEGS